VLATVAAFHEAANIRKENLDFLIWIKPIL